MKVFIIVTLTALSTAAAHVAVSEAEKESLKFLCKPDAERMCKGVELGSGEMKAGLEKNEEGFSVCCAEALKALMEG